MYSAIMLKRDSELNTSKPLQIYTLAHAVRLTKKASNDKKTKTNQLFTSDISTQIKNTLDKIKSNPNIQRQPKSHLPMKMIVSEMATRKPAVEEYNHPQDVSVSKCIKLLPPSWRSTVEPPSWKNKLSQSKARQTCQMQKIVGDIKEKCAQFNSTFGHQPAPPTKGQRHLHLGKSVSAQTPLDCNFLSTPKLDYNYNQLYGASQPSLNLKQTPCFEGEDPLGFDVPEITQEEERQSTEPEEVFEFSPIHSSVQQEENSDTEFVWNPVIVHPKRQLSPVYKLLDCESYRENLNHSFNYDSPPHHPRYVQLHSPCFDIQSPTGNWEYDSTSSQQTVAEERLRLTYFKKRRRPLPNSSILYKKPCLPWTSTQLPENAESWWVDDRSSIFKFLEE